MEAGSLVSRDSGESTGEDLLAWLRQDGTAGSSGADWDAIVALAREQRVVPLLATRLASAGAVGRITPEAGASLTADARAIGMRALGYQRDLALILAALDSVSVPTVLLKGAHLARAIYPNPGLREMNDIDLLIRLADAARGSQALRAWGYDFVAPCNPADGLIGTHHFPRLIKPGAAPIELHVTLTPTDGRLAIDTEGLWQRAEPLKQGSRHAALCPEDLLLHICTHSAYSHVTEFGLRPLCDVREIVNAIPYLDWTAICHRAREWRVARGTFLTLYLAADCLGAEVPDWVLAALRPVDFDARLAALARTHLFTRKTLSVSVPIEATRAYADRSPLELVRQTYRKVVVSRAELAAQFPQIETARFPSWFYVKRALSIGRRHAWLPMAVARRKDRELTAMIDRRSTILRWLEAERRA